MAYAFRSQAQEETPTLLLVARKATPQENAETAAKGFIDFISTGSQEGKTKFLTIMEDPNVSRPAIGAFKKYLGKHFPSVIDVWSTSDRVAFPEKDANDYRNFCNAIENVRNSRDVNELKSKYKYSENFIYSVLAVQALSGDASLSNNDSMKLKSGNTLPKAFDAVVKKFVDDMALTDSFSDYLDGQSLTLAILGTNEKDVPFVKDYEKATDALRRFLHTDSDTDFLKAIISYNAKKDGRTADFIDLPVPRTATPMPSSRVATPGPTLRRSPIPTATEEEMQPSPTPTPTSQKPLTEEEKKLKLGEGW